MLIEEDRRWIQGLFPDVEHGITVSYTERDSHILIIAPHGSVDECSLHVARLLAEEMNASFYECLYSNHKFKIKSIHFHPPFLTELLHNAEFAVAVHGCIDDGIIIGDAIHQ